MRNKAYWITKVQSILVRRAKLDKQTWLRIFKRLIRDIQTHGDELENPAGTTARGDWDPREPLIWGYCVLQSMPQTVRQEYRRLKEHAADGTGIEDSVHELRMRRYRFQGLPEAIELQLRWLATLVRALDQDIAQLDLCFWERGDLGEQWSPTAWQVPDYPCYLIPVDRSHRLRDGKPAERRSLRHHAIVPTRIGEYEVRLTLHPDVGLREPGPAARAHRCGAAIFAGLELSAVTSEVGFLVDGVHCPRQWEQLTGHLDRARSDACDVLMWPELAVPADMAERLAAKLAGEALAADTKIPVIVAGSWHVPCPKGSRTWANRTVVLDGRGVVLFRYDKRMKFEYRSLPEAIEPGTSLQILVTDDQLIAIGICLDFCDDCESHVYQALDVDLILVPSMEYRNTADAHARHARTLQTLHETYVFVVQQAPVERGSVRRAGEPPGFSFVLPESATAPAASQDEPYRFLTGR